jgi:hypothetical protein
LFHFKRQRLNDCVGVGCWPKADVQWQPTKCLLAADIDSRTYSATIRPWASKAARWRINAAGPPKGKRLHGARPTPQVLEDAERLIAAWNERHLSRATRGFK